MKTLDFMLCEVEVNGNRSFEVSLDDESSWEYVHALKARKFIGVKDDTFSVRFASNFLRGLCIVEAL